MAKRSGILLFYPFEEKRFLKWDCPALIQPKLDGFRCRAEQGANLFSSEVEDIVSVPHIKNQVSRLQKYFPYHFDGELYKHGWNFNEISSVCSRTVNLHEDYRQMNYYIFDIVDLSSLQSQRTQTLKVVETILKEEASSFPNLKIVPSYLCYTLQDVYEYYKQFLDDGFEGIIVRHPFATYVTRRSPFGMKFKPKKDDWYNVSHFTEAISKNGLPKNMLGAIWCYGNDGTIFKIGAGMLTHEERKYLWQNREEFLATPKRVHVQYQNITPDGIPRFGLCLSSEFEDAPEKMNYNPLVDGF